MLDKKCRQYIVSGHVQGVWFRVGTQEEARKLGITGWVRNLPNGCVEVLACGSESQLTQLFQWLQQGPPLAKVTEVTYEALEWQACSEFKVL